MAQRAGSTKDELLEGVFFASFVSLGIYCLITIGIKMSCSDFWPGDTAVVAQLRDNYEIGVGRAKGVEPSTFCLGSKTANAN